LWPAVIHSPLMAARGAIRTEVPLYRVTYVDDSRHVLSLSDLDGRISGLRLVLGLLSDRAQQSISDRLQAAGTTLFDLDSLDLFRMALDLATKAAADLRRHGGGITVTELSYRSPLQVILEVSAGMSFLGGGLLALANGWADTRRRFAASSEDVARSKLRSEAADFLRDSISRSGFRWEKSPLLEVRDRMLERLILDAATSLSEIERVDELEPPAIG
jgi:hypothetical protein